MMRRPAPWWFLLVLIASTARPGSGQDAPISPLTPPAPPVPGAPQKPAPFRPRLDQTEEDFRAEEAGRAHLMVVPAISPPLDQARIAGLPAESRPEVLSWERVYQLAWVHEHATPPPRFEAINPDGLRRQARELGFDDFARFRAEFVSSRTFRDPAPDLLDLQARLLEIEARRQNLAYSERWSTVLEQLIEGEASGLNRVDLDRAFEGTVAAQRGFARATADYRDRLDEFKVTLGLAPRAAVAVDLTPLEPFRAVFEGMDRWSLSSRRNLSDLNEIVGKLPPIGDLAIAGRSILGEAQQDPAKLAEVLDLATRFALGNRHERDESADAVELRVRRRVRRLVELSTDYLAEARSLVLAVRLLDGDFERVIAPPAGVAPGSAGPAAAVLVEHARHIAEHRSRLVALWATFQAERLAADRDLGLVLATDWPSFSARFAARPGPLIPTEPARPALDVPVLPVAPPPPVPLPAPPRSEEN